MHYLIMDDKVTSILTKQPGRQLSLENLYVNRTVGLSAAPAERRKQIALKKQQARNIYRALQSGPITTEQLSQMACQYNTRIREIRQWLRQSGQTIDCIPQTGGNNLFKIVPFAGSRYQAELMRKQKKSPHFHTENKRGDERA